MAESIASMVIFEHEKRGDGSVGNIEALVIAGVMPAGVSLCRGCPRRSLPLVRRERCVPHDHRPVQLAAVAFLLADFLDAEGFVFIGFVRHAKIALHRHPVQADPARDDGNTRGQPRPVDTYRNHGYRTPQFGGEGQPCLSGIRMGMGSGMPGFGKHHTTIDRNAGETLG